MTSISSTQILTRSLTALGLEYEHSIIYIVNLKLGVTGAGQIAKAAKLPRTTVYEKLDDLISKGIVSKIKQYNKYVFSPTSPAEVTKILENNLIAQKENINNFTKSIPFLEKNSGFNLSPKVRYYTGEEGLKTVLYDSLLTKMLRTWCCGSAHAQSGLQNDPQYLLDFINKAAIQKLRSKEILMDTPSVQEYAKQYKDNKCTKFLVIPNPKIPGIGHVDKHIYSGKVAYISHDNLVGVIVEDKTLYESEKYFFDVLWRHYSIKSF